MNVRIDQPGHDHSAWKLDRFKIFRVPNSIAVWIDVFETPAPNA